MPISPCTYKLWCHPLPCHGDVLASAASWASTWLHESSERSTAAPEQVYASVGARRTPGPVLAQMRDIARQLTARGWRLRTGGADGPTTPSPGPRPRTGGTSSSPGAATTAGRRPRAACWRTGSSAPGAPRPCAGARRAPPSRPGALLRQSAGPARPQRRRGARHRHAPAGVRAALLDPERSGCRRHRDGDAHRAARTSRRQADTFLTHLFGGGLDGGDREFVVERFRSTYDGEIKPAGDGRQGKGERAGQHRTVSLRTVRNLRPPTTRSLSPRA